MFGIYIVLLLHLRWGVLCLLSLSYKIAKSFLVFITYWHSLFPSTLWGFFMVDDLLSLYSCTAADYVTSGKTILKTHGTRSSQEIIEIMSLGDPWHYMSSRMMILEKITFMLAIEGRVLFEQTRSNLTKTRLLDIHSRERLTCLVVKWITKRST